MRAKYTRLVILLFFWISCLPMQSASADHGPKPSLDFTFTQEFPGTPVNITAGTLFECQQADCSDASPLQESGPQGFSCQIASCHAHGYGFSEYHRLEITFSDGKTRQSNIFKTSGFNAKYNVTIREADLLVEEDTSLEPLLVLIISIGFCLLGLLLFLLLGLIILVVAVIFIVRQARKKK